MCITPGNRSQWRKLVAASTTETNYVMSTWLDGVKTYCVAGWEDAVTANCTFGSDLILVPGSQPARDQSHKPSVYLLYPIFTLCTFCLACSYNPTHREWPTGLIQSLNKHHLVLCMATAHNWSTCRTQMSVVLTSFPPYSKCYCINIFTAVHQL